MTFLNWAMLLGLGAVAVPVVIHLLNRGRGEVVRWGAMKFLLASIASQNRRILIEEALLLAIRCLIVAFVALAMARPFLPSTAGIPWGLLLLMTLASAVCVAVGTALWTHLRVRRALLTGAAALILAAVLAAVGERWLQARRWYSAGSASDVVVLIDGSGSMSIERDGRTNFERAVREAERLVGTLRRSDAVAVYLAGPVPVPLIAKPTSDRAEIGRAFEDDRLVPGGRMGVLEALNAATSSLKMGRNPDKRIVLITDGQRTGWRTGSEAQWEFVKEGLADLSVPAKVICRRLPLPAGVRNVAVSDIRLSRRVVGTDRPVAIDVDIVNTGREAAEPRALNLLVNGTNVATRAVTADILPGSTETVGFSHRFTQPGPHVLTAATEWEDDLSFDNTCERVVRVFDNLRVLIVDGAPSDRPLQGGSAFVEIALSPKEEKRGALMARVWAFLHSEEEPPGEDEEEGPGNLVAPTVVPAPELVDAQDLASYAVVILVNVPRLPSSFTLALTDFVLGGGGLLVVPGDRTDAAFFNGWRTAAGEALLPAKLAQRVVAPGEPVRLLPASFVHPALSLVAAGQQSDARNALVNTYWELRPDRGDGDVSTAGELGNGLPFLVERRLGKGHILMTAMMLDRKAGNLPSLRCFVPLVHELVYYLAHPAVGDYNVKAGTAFAVSLGANDPTQRGDASAAGGRPADLSAPVETPSGRESEAGLEVTGQGMRVTFPGTHQPGTYYARIPTNLASHYSTNLLAGGSLPFVVRGDADESFLTALEDTDVQAIGRYIDLFIADTAAEMTMAVADEVPGQELWKHLVFAALVALVGEIALSRWICLKRRYNADVSVDFGAGNADVTAFRERAEAMLRTRRDDAAPR